MQRFIKTNRKKISLYDNLVQKNMFTYIFIGIVKKVQSDTLAKRE